MGASFFTLFLLFFFFKKRKHQCMKEEESHFQPSYNIIGLLSLPYHVLAHFTCSPTLSFPENSLNLSKAPFMSL